jgi:broad specificity phosphatase PhoE
VSSAGVDAHEIVLVRHAETEWSESGRHTGLTDVPLTDSGRAHARALAATLAARHFELVLVSPAQRARETCELAGLGERASVREDLHEWDYGEYEGLTSAQIEQLNPGWSLWRDGCPGGESAAEVGARADRVIGELLSAGGDVAVFSHGHILRVLGARWIELEPSSGERLGLQTATISVLGFEHGTRALTCWSCATS